MRNSPLDVVLAVVVWATVLVLSTCSFSFEKGEPPPSLYDTEVFIKSFPDKEVLTYCAVTGKNFPWDTFPHQRMRLYHQEQLGKLTVFMYDGPCYTA